MKKYHVEYEYIYEYHDQLDQYHRDTIRECTTFETSELNHTKAMEEFEQGFDVYGGVYIIRFEEGDE